MIATLLVIFLAVALAVFAFLAAYDQKHAQARVLRERLSAVEQAVNREGEREEISLLRDELLSGIPALHRFLVQSERLPRLQMFLAQAGVQLRPGKFLLLSATSGMAAALFATLLVDVSAIVLLALGCGIAAPVAVVAFWRTRRLDLFTQQFPEALDLLGRAVRAGYAFTSALEFMAVEMPEPVSGEFRRLFEEHRFGLPLRDALLNMAERVPILDVKFFATALLVQRDTGGNLAEILDKLSYVMRERFKLQRQVKTYTAQGRLTCGILMVVPPGVALAMHTMNPAFMKPLFHDPLGHFLLGTAIALQIVGFLIIRKIIQVQV
ncbi:MAG: type II secretion system F family protein [Candidatus Korobacteraceae bacterium]